MNIHGYKLKAKSITRLLKDEEKKQNSNSAKIQRLITSKKNCLNKIRELKNKKEVKKK